MSTSSSPIRLTQAHIAAAAQTLGRAFFDDPFVSYLHPDPEKRRQHFAITSGRVLQHALRRGEIYGSSPAMEGVAIWFPPEYTNPSFWEMIRGGAYLLPFQIGFRSFQRVLAYMDHSTKMRERQVHVPHWYLQIFGVAPEHQGKGIGSILLRSMLDRFDREGVPCCLDTEKESNVAMYQHFGFRVLESTPIPGSPCGCWLMMRDVGGSTRS